MKKLFLFSLLTLFATSIFAQIQKGTILIGNNLLNTNYGETDRNNKVYSSNSRFSLLPNGGYFLKDNVLLSGGIGYDRGENKYWLYDPSAPSNYAVESSRLYDEYNFQIGGRYYLPQKSPNHFFIGLNIGSQLYREASYTTNVFPYSEDRYNFYLNFGTNRKIREELYFEGVMGYRHLYSYYDNNSIPTGKGNDNIGTIFIDANFTNFMTYKPKNASKASDILRKGTAIVGGGANISLNTSPLFFMSLSPSYIYFINEQIAIGGTASLFLANSESFNYATSVIAPAVRYHFYSQNKLSLYTQGGVDYVQYSDLREKVGGRNYHQQFTPTLELGADIFVGNALAIEPKMSYNRQTPYYDKGNYNWGTNISMKYFLTQ